MLKIEVENIKCGGCANTIKSRLQGMDGVGEVVVDIDVGVVTVETDDAKRQTIVDRLASLGYPEAGTTEGLGAMTAKAKSFVSCAIGRAEADD